LKVTIVGAGRMGTALAVKLAKENELFVYDRDPGKTHMAAVMVGCRAAESLADCAQGDILILALPSEVMVEAVTELLPYLAPHHILVNVATTTPRSRIEAVVEDRCAVVSAKFIGHAKEIAGGEIPQIIVDAPVPAHGQQVAALFRAIGPVEFGDENIVQRLNTMAATEGIRAAWSIKRKMVEQGIPKQYFAVAVRTVAAGTMKAYASGDAGPFVLDIINRLEKGEN